MTRTARSSLGGCRITGPSRRWVPPSPGARRTPAESGHEHRQPLALHVGEAGTGALGPLRRGPQVPTARDPSRLRRGVAVAALRAREADVLEHGGRARAPPGLVPAPAPRQP